MKFQVVYRDGIAEIHRSTCRDITWDKAQGAVVEAANPYGAAVEAWSHKKTGDDSLVFASTEFFPCLASARPTQNEIEVPSVGLRDSLETKIAIATDWAEEHGWEVKDLGQSLELTLGDQFLVCAWDGNRWDATLSAWTFDGRTVRMPSLTDALRRIAGDGEIVDISGEPRKRVKRPTMKNIPFDIEEDLDDAIIAAVAGRKLIWVNSITGEEESARVMPRGRQTKLSVSSNGRRILTFCDDAGNASTGYRSVALDALVAVK